MVQPGVSRSALRTHVVSLRIAGLAFEIASDDLPFLDELEGRYGDCTDPAPSSAPGLRCAVRRSPSFLEFDFSGHALPDPFESALTPFRMLRHLRGTILEDHPAPGWRAFLREGRNGDVLITGDRTRLRVRLDPLTRDLAIECLVAVALRAQPEILFLHAASFAIRGKGALLVGPAKTGKSSTVLTLASRGHGFLGDDLAAVHRERAELLPFPKSAGFREGATAEQLESRARAFRSIPGTGLDGVPRRYVRVRDMFPGSGTPAASMAFVFILDGFASSASATAYRPDVREVERLKAVVSENVPGWGESAGGDLLRFLRVTDLFSRARCYLLKLGSLDESAMLIETTMGIT